MGNTNPLYRSLLERKFFYHFDNNANVTAWSSESIVVPYYNDVDKKVHKYHIDLSAAIKDNTGVTQKYLIELQIVVKRINHHSSYSIASIINILP